MWIIVVIKDVIASNFISASNISGGTGTKAVACKSFGELLELTPSEEARGLQKQNT